MGASRDPHSDLDLTEAVAQAITPVLFIGWPDDEPYIGPATQSERRQVRRDAEAAIAVVRERIAADIEAVAADETVRAAGWLRIAARIARGGAS